MVTNGMKLILWEILYLKIWKITHRIHPSSIGDREKSRLYIKLKKVSRRFTTYINENDETVLRFRMVYQTIQMKRLYLIQQMLVLI